MLLFAGGVLVGVSPTTMAPVLAGLLLVALLMVLDRILVWEGIESTWVRGLLPITLGMSPAFVRWWFSGLEVPAYALLIVLICWRLACCDTSRWTHLLYPGALLAVIALLRAEGVLMSAVALGYILISTREGPVRARAKAATALLVPVLLALAAMTLLRLAYYGEWLPNTYYAKLGTPLLPRLEQGIMWLKHEVTYMGGSAPFIIAAIGMVWSRRRRFMILAAVTAALYIGFFVYSGGDAIGSRFFVHVTPLLYVMAWMGALAIARRLASQEQHNRVALHLVGLALLVLFMPTLGETPHYKQSREFPRKLHLIASVLRENIPIEFKLATCAAGVIPYITKMPTIDMLGLCDKHIARSEAKSSLIGHQKWDGYYVVSQSPDVIVQSRILDRPDALQNIPERGLVNFPRVFNEIRSDPRFQRNYSRVSIPLSDGRWFVFWGHNRRDWKTLIPDAVIVPVASDYPEEGRAPQ